MINMGKIGYSKYCISRGGDIYSLYVNRIISKNIGTDGYYYSTLYPDSGKKVTVAIHRLLGLMFKVNSDPTNKTMINHINGVKTDNRLSNLEWVTPSENNLHAVKNGLHKAPNITSDTKMPDKQDIIHDWRTKGKTTKDASDDDIHKVCQLLQEGYRVCDVSGMTGFDRYVVRSLRHGDNVTWKFITDTYDFSKVARVMTTSPEKVIKICELLVEGFTINHIANVCGVGRKVVSGIKSRENFISISSKFNF